MKFIGPQWQAKASGGSSFGTLLLPKLTDPSYDDDIVCYNSTIITPKAIGSKGAFFEGTTNGNRTPNIIYVNTKAIPGNPTNLYEACANVLAIFNYPESGSSMQGVETSMITIRNNLFLKYQLDGAECSTANRNLIVSIYV